MVEQETKREGGSGLLFWAAVGSVIGIAMLAIYLVSPGPYRQGPLPAWYRPVHYLAAGILVAAVWAILFRAQVVKLRISLTAIFVLILMESIYLFAIRYVNPDWAF